jgi:hypothetical protein
MRRAFGLAAMAFVAFGALAGCHKAKKYDANVEVTRISVVRKDENGRALTTDFEFSYFECPGAQSETIRGGEEFSACVSKIAVGSKVPIKLEHHWDPEGRMVWDVFQVADCKRPPDPNDEASYAMVRECADWKVNGATVGFECQIIPKKDLIQKCPWFAHH